MDPISANLRSEGFAVIPSLVRGDELDNLRTAYDELLAMDSAGDRLLGGLTRQIMVPELAHSTFDDNLALTEAKKFAEQEMGWRRAERSFSMLIYKPPQHPHETPWHQDMAYYKKPVAESGRKIRRQTLQFWLAIDDASVDNGCMHFIAGDITSTLPHHVASGDEEDDGRLLAIEESVDVNEYGEVVACPIAAGGATVHHEGTLHFTPANQSSKPRRAYIFNLYDAAGVE